MVAVKQRELERAVDLYRQAYQPVRDEPTLEVLQRQTALLSAAEALEKRAERIQEWPFDEATFARVVTITSSVAAVVIARIILDPVGL
jgi:acyl-CoA reductase-like NAD-dependent aldehyde dehydrogenase